MPRKNEYTFVVERPMSADAAMRSVKLLAELGAEREGFRTNAVPRKLRPGEEYRLAYPPKESGISVAG